MSSLDNLRVASPEVREAALVLLDEISAPMNARELDRAFQNEGFSRAQARRMTLALKHIFVIALVRK